MSALSVACYPFVNDGVRRAIVKSGAQLADLEDCEALIWTAGESLDEVSGVLARSNATWVQLPWADVSCLPDSLWAGRVFTSMKGAFGDSLARLVRPLIEVTHRMATASASADRNIANYPREVGVLGSGGVGRAVAETLFDVCSVTVFARRPIEWGPFNHLDRLREIAHTLDLIVCCLPATKSTYSIVDRHVMRAVGIFGSIIHVGGPGVVNENDLGAALAAGELGASGLDLPRSTAADRIALMRIKTALVLPHVGVTQAVFESGWQDRISENILRRVEGAALVGVVNPADGH